jgi:hypothetical protein
MIRTNEVFQMPLNAVLATAPSITFHPEPATRAALARMANVKEFSLSGFLNWMIVRHDEAWQAKLAHVDENDLAAYLDGRMTPREFGLACHAYGTLKDQPPPKKRRAALKVVEAAAEAMPAEAAAETNGAAEPATNAA